MKIYSYTPVDVIRVSIKQTGEKGDNVGYVSLTDCSQVEVIEFFKEFLKDLDLPVAIEGNRTYAVFREAKGGKNGKSKSVSFHLNGKHTSVEVMTKFLAHILDCFPQNSTW